MTIAELEQENEKLQQATIPAAQLEEFLDLPAKKKLEKAIKVFEAAKLAEMREEFTKELAAKRAELKAQQEKLAEDQYAVTQLRKQLSDARETVDRMMTYDEFKLIRGCLHPDRHPEDVREKFGRAFDIFARLEKCIDPHQPIKLLRERGWPHLSPFARGKTA
jgi:hypothetical protein